MQLVRGIAIGLILGAAAVLTISGLWAQSSKQPDQWPSLADRPKVVQGFTRALTRSAKDKAFRDDLLKFTDQKTVRNRIQEELNKVPGAEKMVIPPEIVLIFYVPQKEDGAENRNYHIFYLPAFNPEDKSEHPYDVHLKCCYFPW